MTIFGNFLKKMSSFWQFFDIQIAICPEGQDLTQGSTSQWSLIWAQIRPYSPQI